MDFPPLELCEGEYSIIFNFINLISNSDFLSSIVSSVSIGRIRPENR